MVIPVKVIRCDIHQYGYLSLEIEHSVKLEAAQFDHVVIISSLRHRHREAVSHISGHGHIEPGFLHHVIYQVCGGGLAIASCHADLGGIGIATCKLDLRDYRDALFMERNHNGVILLQTRTLYHLIGIHYKLLSVLPLLKGNTVRDKYLTVLILDGPAVGNEDVKSLLLTASTG